MIVLIDNYDSFTHNLAHYIAMLGKPIHVVRNDVLTLAELDALRPEAVVLSPGPRTPDDAGICLAAIAHLWGRTPLLGICLGHQSIGQFCGGTVVRAREPVHGKVMPIEHTGTGVFRGLRNPLRVTRYHSLVLERAALPEDLVCTAWTAEGEIMGIRHRHYPLEGVQFHPEALLTEQGLELLNNFMLAARRWNEERVW